MSNPSKPDELEVLRLTNRDEYRPAGGRVPVVVLVSGPRRVGSPPARTHPMFDRYGRLLAGLGIGVVIPDVPYSGLADWPAEVAFPPSADWVTSAAALGKLIEGVRTAAWVDEERLAVWAFSGGCMLTGPWLRTSPPWLRCLALSYPALAGPDAPIEVIAPGRAVVLTRVGRERPEWQDAVDRLLARAREVGAAVHVIDVPDGVHGFDALIGSLADSPPVREAAQFVALRLRPLK